MGKHDNPAGKGDGHVPGGYDHSKTKPVEDAGSGKHDTNDKGKPDDDKK